MMNRITVVGASLAGLRAVETLRAEGFSGAIDLVGAEPYFPYNRPPLSKQVLNNDWHIDELYFRDDVIEDVLDVNVHLGSAATRLDTARKTVSLENGTRIPYDGLIIATGADARRLPGSDRLDGVHTLRTLDDALAIKAALQTGPRVAVVGAGFVGAEVASAARERGLEVTIIEAMPRPLGHILGDEMSRACSTLHTSHGTVLKSGVTVTAIEGSSCVERLQLSDGTFLAADLVVVGIGAVPATDWLEGSGVHLDNGVVCDATCATNIPDVYAAGDVARWNNPHFDGELMRIEHWTHAAEQGAAAAKSLLAGNERAAPFASVPYFWSDQYGTRIQFAGRGAASSEPHTVHGSVGDHKFVTLYRDGNDLTGVLAFGSPRPFMRYRQKLLQKSTWEEALETVASIA